MATHYDHFEACSHWIYLLRGDGRPIDQLRMPDQLGFLHEVQLVSGNEVSFGYFGTNDRWTLAVSEAGFRCYAADVLLRRPTRFLLARRHLAMQRRKGAPWSAPATSAPGVEPTSRR
jgi:hypothetical protein